MIFVLKTELAAVVGPQRTRILNDAMRLLTGAQLSGEAAGAKLDLQRELFTLEHAQTEEMEP